MAYNCVQFSLVLSGNMQDILGEHIYTVSDKILTISQFFIDDLIMRWHLFWYTKNRWSPIPRQQYLSVMTTWMKDTNW